MLLIGEWNLLGLDMIFLMVQLLRTLRFVPFAACYQFCLTFAFSTPGATFFLTSSDPVCLDWVGIFFRHTGKIYSISLLHKHEEMNLHCPRGITLMNANEKVSKVPSDFVWPAMVKSLQASGALSAHDMAVVWSLEDVDKYAYPLYLQEYVNHDGTIFKVYVLGEDHFTVTRVSLPNFPTSYHAPVQFNSQAWKHELPPELTMEYTGKRVAPAHDLLNRASEAVSQLLGLTLFGFDVIENVDTGRLAVIDVNYFPGTCISARQWLCYDQKRDSLLALKHPNPVHNSDLHFSLLL